MLALAESHSGFPTLLQQLSRLEAPSSASTRGKVAASLFVLDLVQLGLLPVLRRLSCLDVLLLLFGFDHLSSPPLLRALAHPGLPALLFAAMHMDMGLPILDFGLLGASLPIRCASRPEVALPAHDHLCFDALPLARSPARLDFLVLVLDVSYPGSSPTARNLARIGFIASTSGLSRTGFVSLLSASEGSMPDAPLPLRAPAKLEIPFAVPEPAHLSSLMLLQSCFRLGSTVFTMGLSRPGPVSPLPVVDVVHLASFLPLRSSAWPGSVPPATDSSHVSASLLLRHAASLDSLPFTFGCARPGSTAFALDLVHFEMLLLLRKAVRCSVDSGLFTRIDFVVALRC